MKKKVYNINYIEDFIKLLKLSEQFWGKCLVKLALKNAEGYTGWDSPDYHLQLIKALEEHIKKPWTPDNLIDMAIFCMFIWNLTKEGDI